MSEKEHALLPDGAVVFNAASDNEELGVKSLLTHASPQVFASDGNRWSTFQGKAVCLGQPDDAAHTDSVVRMPNGHEIYVPYNGYVISFTGERDTIPPRYIQFVRALLLLGAIAAKRHGKPGFVHIPGAWQEALVKLVERGLSRTGESLYAPSWEKHGDDVPPVHHEVPPEVPQMIRELSGEQ